MKRTLSFLAGFMFAAQSAAADLPKIDQDVLYFSVPPDLSERYITAKTAYWGGGDDPNSVLGDDWKANVAALNAAADAYDSVVGEVFARFADARDDLSRETPTAMAFYSSEQDGDQILGVVTDVREFLGIDFSILAVDTDLYPDISHAYDHEGPAVRVVYGYTYYSDFPAGDWSVPNFMSFMEGALSDLTTEEPSLELFAR